MTSCAASTRKTGPLTSYDLPMLIVLIAFTVLMLIGMPVAFAIGISGLLFFLQNPELPADASRSSSP